jgi:hypothetical protein
MKEANSATPQLDAWCQVSTYYLRHLSRPSATFITSLSERLQRSDLRVVPHTPRRVFILFTWTNIHTSPGFEFLTHGMRATIYLPGLSLVMPIQDHAVGTIGLSLVFKQRIYADTK